MLESCRSSLLGQLNSFLLQADLGERRYILQQLETALRLSEKFFNQGKPSLAGTYFSAWVKIIAQQNPHFIQPLPLSREDLDRFWRNWRSIVGPCLQSEENKLNVFIESADKILSRIDDNTLRVLFIGDCLAWDIALQLQILLESESITIDPIILAKRLGPDLRRSLVDMASEKVDLIFYSPYSFEFSKEYAYLVNPRNVLRVFSDYSKNLLSDSLIDVKKTINTLHQSFNCPVYVHNVSGVQQSKDNFLGKVVSIATAPFRKSVSNRLNVELDTYLSELNKELDIQIQRIDETKHLRDKSSWELGRITYNVGELHPTLLAETLAGSSYLTVAKVVSLLSMRKLIICDLDNTLWDGVIGEGAVTHFADRQSALLSLKNSGIVLAVCSKNDPNNVNWDGSVLSCDDFVATEINWESKPNNIQRIVNKLNLKPSSFVFIDDRIDERELVQRNFPEILTLDPNDDFTWQLFSSWVEITPRSELEDRTALYRQREARQDYLESVTEVIEDESAMFKSLGLRVVIRSPSSKELKRVAELINRTNQFNTTAARNTFNEIKSYSKSRNIIIADVSDKFGAMGIVGVIIVDVSEQHDITHFVLSCRVFGYGIESALLNAVKRSNGERKKITAKIIETPVNGPCQDVYKNNGFVREGEAWTFFKTGEVVDPEWLSIESQL